MTWVATIAYIGAVAFIIGHKPFWKFWSNQWFYIWFVLLLFTALAVIWFIHLQFIYRNKASVFYTSCYNVAAQILYGNITKNEFAIVPLHELDSILVPCILSIDFHKNYRGKVSCLQKLTLALLIIWSICGIFYVLLTYFGFCNILCN